MINALFAATDVRLYQAVAEARAEALSGESLRHCAGIAAARYGVDPGRVTGLAADALGGLAAALLAERSPARGRLIGGMPEERTSEIA